MSTDFNFDSTADEVAAHLASHIHGKTVLTTGVSPGGLGAYFVKTIAKYQPKLIILASRDIEKAKATAQAISSVAPDVQTRVLELDLGSQAQVRKAAAEVNAYEESIDVLVNNAAVMACPYATTTEGLELQFGTNHIGHFLFTNLTLPDGLTMKFNDFPVNNLSVVNVSSAGHRLSPIRWDDINFSDGKTYHEWRAYGQSKTANMLFSLSLAEKLGPKGLVSASVHPGTINTNLGRFLSNFESLQALDRELGNQPAAFKWKTEAQGTATYVVASFDPTVADHNGAYLLDCQVATAGQFKPYALDKEDAERLWKMSEEIVGQTFEY